MRAVIAALSLSFMLATPAHSGDLKDDLIAIEKSLWTAWSKKDAAVFEKHLTADYVQAVAGAGVASGRDKIVADLGSMDCNVASFTFIDASLRKLGPDVVIVSYTATQDATCGGEKLPPKVFVMSAYVRQQDRWLSASYQETPID